MNWACADVRMAVGEDRQAIVDLTNMLHEENGLFPISRGKVDLMLDRYFNRDGALIGVIGGPGEPVATIYLGLDQLIYTDDWTLVEQWNFVAPDHRRSDYARQLIGWAKNLSDEFQIPLLTGILSNTRTEAKVRLYEQLMEKVGAFFVYGRQHSATKNWG